jgi:hypothetical protein
MSHSTRLCLLLSLTVTSAGCDGIGDYLTNRFKTCDDVRADLINSEQSRFPVYLTGPGEEATQETLLQSGQKRSISVCLERGDAKRFLAHDPTSVIGTINCVAFKASYEGSFVQVIWSPAGFICQNW